MPKSETTETNNKNDQIQTNTQNITQTTKITEKEDDQIEKSILSGKDFLTKENDEGNIEYKWKLVNISEERFKHLVTQMQFRLLEGKGEALYEIGVTDDGIPLGLNEKEFTETFETLKKMAKTIKADVSLICKKEVGKVTSQVSQSVGKKLEKKLATEKKTEEEKSESRFAGEVLVRQYGDGKYLDVRMAVCGNVDAGKSTLIGTLTGGVLDNGRGLARIRVFKHKHEISSGRTSDISHEILGFDSTGNIVNYSKNFGQQSWKEIIEQSTKVLTFIDLAGHEKYLKTTVRGMTGSIPDYSLVVIGSNNGITKMTKEHIGLCLALKIPIVIVITKIDMCPTKVLKKTISQVKKLLKLPGVRMLPFIVKDSDDIISCTKNLGSQRIAPIFLLSCVSGEGLDNFKKFLNLLPQRFDWESKISSTSEVFIDETFFVTGIGTVVSGTVRQGSISVNDNLSLGPDANGKWRRVQVKSIESKRVPVKSVVAGMSASFALKKIKRNNIRKGMVMIDDNNPPVIWEFIAEVFVLYHSTTIQSNYQPVVHCMSIKQAAKIVEIMGKESLRTGDKAKVKFRFMFKPEYIKEGERLIFREGRTKGLGVITEVITTKVNSVFVNKKKQ